MNIQQEYTIRSVQYPGRAGNNCEDVKLISEHPGSYLFAGLADGQSGQEHCKEGGMSALCTVCRYIQTYTVSGLAQRYAEDIQYELMLRVRENLSCLSRKYQAPRESFASTLCCFACDTVTGAFMLINLGDGCLLGVTKQGQLRVLSCPENSITSRRTWLTTSHHAASHMRLSWGNCKNYSAFYLLTDGADCICRDGWIVPKTREQLLHRTFWSLTQRLERCRRTDDASLMMIST